MPEMQVQVKQVGATTSEGSIRHHAVLIDRPAAKGGEDKGPMGGELLLVALGGCFMSNLLEVIRTREAPINNVNIDIAGTLEGTPPHYTHISMKVRAEHDDADLLEKLVLMSERACIVANTLKPALMLAVSVA